VTAASRLHHCDLW